MFIANKPLILPVAHQEVLVEVRPRVGRHISTQAVEPLNPQRLRSIQRPRLARPNLRLRLTRLLTALVTAQRHRLTRRLRLVHHTERATARLLRLTLTLRDLLVMQLAQADQRLRTAIHQP